MDSYSFRNDYSEGAHPAILQALAQTNMTQQNGYCQDDYSNEAVTIIRNKIKNQNADIHFVSGGTQANLIVISSILKPFESVISANSGHINIHEAGSIEATGHKINTFDSVDGKLKLSDIKSIVDQHTNDPPHMVKPRLVYLSNSTEIGTIYQKKELEEISLFCKSNNLYLFLDGARLGSALCSKQNDLTLAELSSLVDIFYIGGTKNGALIGEAIVINNNNLKTDFDYNLKQKGALLGKGRLFGVQFCELFKNDLYFELAKHANTMAEKLSKNIEKLAYSFLTQSTTNQIFPILPNKVIEHLSQKYGFYVWAKIDAEKSAIRLVTSWATKEEAVDCFISDLKSL